MMVLTGFGRPALAGQRLVLPMGERAFGLRPELGQGRLSAAPISDAARRAIERRISAILSALENEYQKIVNELELAMSTESYKEVAIVGLVMSREEVLGQVASDATALGRLADEISQAAGGYLTSDQARRLDETESALDEVRATANREGGRFPSPANAGPAAEHQELHLAALRTMKDTLQRAIVEAEAGAVPVEEPFRMPWLAIGAGALGLGLLIAILD